MIRGSDNIAYLGYNVGLRPWVEKNGETIEKFLAAVSEADKWMRANPKQAAQVATRWIPGLKTDIAETAMEFNIQQADRRLSANNYRALWSAQDRLSRLGVIKSTFTPTSTSSQAHPQVMKKHPELFRTCRPSRRTSPSRRVRVQALSADRFKAAVRGSPRAAALILARIERVDHNAASFRSRKVTDNRAGAGHNSLRSATVRIFAGHVSGLSWLDRAPSALAAKSLRCSNALRVQRKMLPQDLS